jgi:hypothetical protein
MEDCSNSTGKIEPEFREETLVVWLIHEVARALE